LCGLTGTIDEALRHGTDHSVLQSDHPNGSRQRQARSTIAYGVDHIERALAKDRYLAGADFSLADINVLSSIQRMPRWAPDLMNDKASPRTFAWLERLRQRPAIKAALSISKEAPPLETDALGVKGPARC
jgi:glutathione S-transferase